MSRKYKFQNLNNPLKYTDPSGFAPAPILFEDRGANAMNQYALAWLNQSLNFGDNYWTLTGQVDYHYSEKHKNYYIGAGSGGLVSYEEVYNNYIVPNSTDITDEVKALINTGSDDIVISFDKKNIGVADTKALQAGESNTVAALNDFYESFGSLVSPRGYGLSYGGPDGPFINVELNIKFGITFLEKLKFFGLGEELNVNAISIDYMTFLWNSNAKRIKYIPYRTATSSFSLGIVGLYLGAKQDWGQMRFSPNGQLGITYLERKSPPIFNIIDVGYMFGFGFDFKVTINPNKFFNSYIEYQSEWDDKVGGSIYPFLH